MHVVGVLVMDKVVTDSVYGATSLSINKKGGVTALNKTSPKQNHKKINTSWPASADRRRCLL